MFSSVKSIKFVIKGLTGISFETPRLKEVKYDIDLYIKCPTSTLFVYDLYMHIILINTYL